MIVRPPAERFEELPDFEYEHRFADVGDLEMAYVDEGDGEETFLCLHGEPTWSFLYRKMIPRLTDRGRVVAPDLIGFGRSDRYEDPDKYSVEMHYEALEAFLLELDLSNVTLVCQDWGGVLGLPLATHHDDRFSRLVPMNTGVPDGTHELPEIWHEFADTVANANDLDIGRIVQNGCYVDLDEEVLDAYRAPFPDESHMAGARTFPGLVPQSPDDRGVALMRETKERLSEWEKPAFVLFAEADPIFRGGRDPMRDLIPTATEQPDVWVEEASHFLQEDAGEEIANHIVDFVDRT